MVCRRLQSRQVAFTFVQRHVVISGSRRDPNYYLGLSRKGNQGKPERSARQLLRLYLNDGTVTEDKKVALVDRMFRLGWAAMDKDAVAAEVGLYH